MLVIGSLDDDDVHKTVYKNCLRYLFGYLYMYMISTDLFLLKNFRAVESFIVYTHAHVSHNSIKKLV